jgi:hypothetical protein
MRNVAYLLASALITNVDGTSRNVAAAIGRGGKAEFSSDEQAAW